MLIQVFTLRFDELKERFVDDELTSFFQANQILSVRDYLFTKNDRPYLTLVVTFQPFESEHNPQKQKRNDDSWKDMLTDADMGLFSMLREWRGKRCKKDGLPPYILFTNKQLAYIKAVSH